MDRTSPSSSWSAFSCGIAPIPYAKASFAVVAAEGARSGIYVYALAAIEWRLLQFIPAKEPVALAIHPDQRTLYILHEVGEHATLPRGYVSAYRICKKSGYTGLLWPATSLSFSYISATFCDFAERRVPAQLKWF